MNIDINTLVNEIESTLSSIIKKDITTVRGFSKRQLNGISNQTALLATGIATGQISKNMQDFFLEQLIELARNFVHTLVGLLMATIEKLWNAFVKILWTAIESVIGHSLPSFEAI